MRPTRLIPGILLAALYCIPSFASATPLTTMTCNDAESPHGNGISANVHCLAESDIIAASDDPFGGYVSDIARNHAQDFDGGGVGPSFANVTANESLQPTPVPEPASLVLLGSGVVALVARRRRARRE